MLEKKTWVRQSGFLGQKITITSTNTEKTREQNRDRAEACGASFPFECGLCLLPGPFWPIVFANLFKRTGCIDL